MDRGACNYKTDDRLVNCILLSNSSTENSKYCSKTTQQEPLIEKLNLKLFSVLTLQQENILTLLCVFLCRIGKPSIMLEELRRALHYHASTSSPKVTKESAMDEIRMMLRLFSSVYQGDLAEFKCLLKAGVDPNSTDCEGNSLMHIVIENGLYDMVEILLTHSKYI